MINHLLWSNEHGTLYPQVQIRIVCAPKFAFISLSIHLNMCFGCSKEPSHWDCSFEYPNTHNICFCWEIRKTRNVSMGRGCPSYYKICINRELSLTKGNNSWRHEAIWAILQLEDIMVLDNVAEFHRIIIKTIHLREQTSFQPTILHKLRP